MQYEFCVVFCHLQFAGIEQGTGNASPLQPNHVAFSDYNHTARAKSSVYAGAANSFCQSHDQSALYQMDSLTRGAVNSTATNSCSQLDAVSTDKCDLHGRDAFMASKPVLSVLEMGFDHETVRNVVHLKMVQSGRTHAAAHL